MAIAEHVTLGASPGFDPGGPKFLSPAGGRAGRSPARVALKSDDRPAVHAERRVAASAGKANCRRNIPELPQRLAALAAASAPWALVEPAAPVPVEGEVVPAGPPVVPACDGLVVSAPLVVPLLDVVPPAESVPVPMPAVPPAVPVPPVVPVVELEVDELVSVLVPVAASSRRWQAVREAAAISAMVLS